MTPLIDLELIAEWQTDRHWPDMSRAQQAAAARDSAARNLPADLDFPRRAHVLAGDETWLLSFDPAVIDPVQMLHVFGAVLPALMPTTAAETVAAAGLCIYVLDRAEVVERIELFMGRVS